MAKVTYNERSWAIDVISEINLFLAQKSWHIKSAGGENTIRNNKKSLFPDVLLFKDQTKETILQGWELKMPDTLINDSELINNAIKKAKILQRDSFVLWNVTSAVLYRKNDSGIFEIFKNWTDIAIHSRGEVKNNETLWKKLLFQILEDLNSFFDAGEISEAASLDILSIDEIIDVVLENTSGTIVSINQKIRTNSRIDAQVNYWWTSSSNEYGFDSNDTEHKLPTLSMVVLTDWVFKIVFAHVLKRHFNEAKTIESIVEGTSLNEAISIITTISENCNFWSIFSENLAQDCISDTAWSQIVELNIFLSNLNIERIDIDVLHQLLQASVESAKRKVAGQFSTPPNLANLLVRLTLEDRTKIVLDPCCGTGTIINQAYLLKEECGINQNDTLDSIWASDKHSFPLQLSTLHLTKPSIVGKILNIFRSDVTELEVGKMIPFKDPNNGSDVIKPFPQIDYIVSNLPFIKSKDIKALNLGIDSINQWIKDQTNGSLVLSGKSDIFAYIPFYLHKILSENGKIGLILSNAWLGTDYGDIFLELFQKFFDIESVIISGKGKWFSNADVVTTLITAKKKSLSQSSENNSIKFCTLLENIDTVSDIKTLSENIILDNETSNVKINQYTHQEITILERIGVPWCGYFADLKWLHNIEDKLINTNIIFNFTRGERRGWNPLFYPTQGHNIESNYIKPVLKNLRNTSGLVCIPNKDAFCCSESTTELTKLGHSNALAWIKSFESQNNKTGVPLTQSLKRANMFWYEMKTDNMADFVANVNYDRSLFIAKVENRSFIDQRLIGFSIKREYESEDKNLYLALFNSILSMFFIESFGFGRGLGALDLRATKFNKDFKILNPSLLSDVQKNNILEAFAPLLTRNRLPLEQEIESEDRKQFETILFEAFGIESYYGQIKSALLHLYKIRFAVKDS